MLWRYKVYNVAHKAVIYSLWGVSLVGAYGIYVSLKRLRNDKDSQLEQLK